MLQYATMDTTETYYIYKICCDDIDEFYIGSTQSIRHRKTKHKSHSNGDKRNYKIYQTIRQNGGWDNWRMVVIEEMPNTTKIGATIREEFYRVELKASLNSQSACSGLTVKEYQKQYRATHREEAKEYKRQYYQKQKESNATHREEINRKKRETYARKKAEKLSAT